MGRWFASLLIFLVSATSFARGNHCESLFFKIEIDSIISSLAQLGITLDVAKARNDKSLVFKSIKKDFDKKKQDLLDYVSSNNLLTVSEVNKKLEIEIARMQDELEIAKNNEEKNRQAQDEVVLLKKIDGTEMILNKVRGGKVKYDLIDYDIAPFDLMATTTTHFMWRKVIELGKKHMNLIDERLIDDIPTRPDDIPIMKVSYEQIICWISVLNSLSAMGVEELLDFIPSFKKGDKFSLPTKEQWYFVLTSGGLNYESPYFFGSDIRLLKDYGWYRLNAYNVVQPVAKLLPLVLHGHEYYDVVGNIWQFVFTPPPPGALIPLKAEAWGGSVFDPGISLQNKENWEFDTKRRGQFGFRLTRIRK